MSGKIEHASTGCFEYVEADDGWSDSFRVVDTDGMPFDLTRLRDLFEGRYVRITVTYDPAEEDGALAKDATLDPPDVYKQIGMTVSGYSV